MSLHEFEGVVTPMPTILNIPADVKPWRVAQCISGLIKSIRGDSYFYKIHKSKAIERGLNNLIGTAENRTKQVFLRVGFDSPSFDIWLKATHDLDIGGQMRDNTIKTFIGGRKGMSGDLSNYWFKELYHRCKNIYLRRLLSENGVQLKPIRQDASFDHLEEIRNGSVGPDPLPLPFCEIDLHAEEETSSVNSDLTLLESDAEVDPLPISIANSDIASTAIGPLPSSVDGTGSFTKTICYRSANDFHKLIYNLSKSCLP